MLELKGKTVAILLEELYNEHEFWYPKIRLQEAGVTMITAGTEGAKDYHSKLNFPARADMSFGQLKADVLDGVIIPGGYAPDYMRRSPECLKLVADLHKSGKLVAFICHAGWVPISAKIVAGKKVTSHSCIKDDMINAGAIWQDSAVVQDENLISSRSPQDIPEFMRAIIAFLKTR